MPEDLSSAVAEMMAQERGGNVEETPPTTPVPASDANVTEPTEHQTIPAATPATTEAKPAFDPDALTPEQVSDLLRTKAAQAAIFRHAQSMKDKEIARIQREQEAARKQDEERRKLAEMDDEEYGRHVREQQQIETTVTERAIASMMPVLHNVQATTLGKLSDPQIRAKVEQRIASGDLADLGQILDTVLEAETDARVQKATAKLEEKLRKDIREALEKEFAAKAAEDDDAPPILGSGLPTGSRELHGTALLAAGVAEARRQVKKGK